MALEYKRYFFKVWAGPNAGGNPIVYSVFDLTFDQFAKWRWYLEYRAALVKVQNPRWNVDTTWGNYDWMPAADQYLKDLKNKIAGKRREITKWTNAIENCDKPWERKAGLFINDYPLEKDRDYLLYQKAIAKIERHKKELKSLIEEQMNLEK